MKERFLSIEIEIELSKSIEMMQKQSLLLRPETMNSVLTQPRFYRHTHPFEMGATFPAKNIIFKRWRFRNNFNKIIK
jgi:hypothetical protein